MPTPLSRCVGNVDEFESAWGHRPVLIAGSNPSAFTDLLSLADVDRILSLSARRPTVRMVLNGEPLQAGEFCSGLRLGGRYLDDVVDPRKVADQFRRGATLVLQSLHRTWPAVSEFVAGLQHEVSHPVQANAYLTPASATGLAPHSDAHDVIVLQSHGSKQWQVDGLGDIELHAGDRMYIPAGTVHRAATSEEVSLHITLGVIRVTYRDVVERLLADGPADLDVPLPIGYQRRPSEDLKRRVAAALDRTREHLATVDVDGCVRRERQRRRRPVQQSHLSSLVDLDALTPQHRLRWSAADPLGRVVGASPHDGWRSLYELSPSDGQRVEVRLNDRTITVPSVVLDALRRLQCRDAVAVDDLPGLDSPSRLILARRLVEETACVIEVAPPTHLPTEPIIYPTRMGGE